MLDNKELEQIGGMVRKVVTEVVTEIVDWKIDSLMEHQILPQFELIHTQLATKASAAELSEVKQGLRNVR